MADIELVIKIPEEEYINIKDAINSLIENGVERASMSNVCLAILDGTPLPKGHGRLIDADTRRNEIGEEDRWVVDLADTVVEADRKVVAKTASVRIGGSGIGKSKFASISRINERKVVIHGKDNN